MADMDLATSRSKDDTFFPKVNSQSSLNQEPRSTVLLSIVAKMLEMIPVSASRLATGYPSSFAAETGKVIKAEGES